MKLNRFFKIIFLSEFIKAIMIAIKEIFKKKKRLITLLRREASVRDLEENML